MDPSVKGIDRLLNEEDRAKLRGIEGQLKEYLDDLTAEDNDVKYGYVGAKTTEAVPSNPALLA